MAEYMSAGYNDFVSEVVHKCTLFVDPTQIPSIEKFFAEGSYHTKPLLWRCYQQMLTPAEAATEIINEFVMTHIRRPMQASS
jgi:hypothetical protein